MTSTGDHFETFVPAPGGRLFAVADGDGPPIVLLHAGIADLRAWNGVVPPLAQAGYRVVRFDMRGLGRSTTEDVEFSRRADVRAVMDALGVERAAIVGNSIGGMTALDLALESPERVVALVLVAPGIGGFDGGSTPEELAAEAEVEAAYEAGDADRVAELDVRFWVDGVGQPSTRVPAAIRDLVYAMDRPSCEPGHVSGRHLPIEPPANERLGSIAVPTLAIGGGLDSSASLAAVERVVAGVPGALGLVIPHVAHMIGMEEPELLAALIDDHLRALRPWA